MIYIHIGLPKTATTFFQERVFPNWENIEYLGRTVGYDVPFRRVVNVRKCKKYLISEEGISGLRFKSDYEKESTIQNLSEMFPDAKIMISFRKHQSLINSFYKQSILRGETFSFEEFYDIENDIGALKKDSVNYRSYIEYIQKYFKNEPFVYLQEELKYNFPGLLKDMGEFFEEESPSISELNMTKINEGLGYYQAKLLLNINKLFSSPQNPDGLLPYNNYTHFGRVLSKKCCEKLSPLSKKPLKINKEQKDFCDTYYKDDWEYILNYIDSECNYRKHFDKLKY